MGVSADSNRTGLNRLEGIKDVALVNLRTFVRVKQFPDGDLMMPSAGS